jgi:hypothetical protein
LLIHSPSILIFSPLSLTDRQEATAKKGKRSIDMWEPWGPSLDQRALDGRRWMDGWMNGSEEPLPPERHDTQMWGSVWGEGKSRFPGRDRI